MEPSGIEAPTSWLQTRSSSIATSVNKEVTSSQVARCTPRCTENAELTNDSSEAPLAEFVATLTAEQRRRLAAMLLGQGEGHAS